MYLVKKSNDKYQFTERYKDKYTDKWRTVSVNLDRDTTQSRKKAQKILDDKILSKGISRTEKMSLNELIEKWRITHYKSVKDISKRSYDSAIKVIQKNFDTNIKVDKINPSTVQDFFDSEKISNYSNNYRSLIKIVMNTVLEYAVNLEYITINPMLKVKVTMKKITISEVETVRNKYLTTDEITLFLSSFTKRQYRYKLISEFFILTGLRFGELQAIRNIDITDNILQIERTFDSTSNPRNPNFTSPKSLSAYRKIELPERCLEIIVEINDTNEILKTNDDFIDCGIIFCSRNGGVIPNNNFNATLKKVTALSGISKNITAHVLRHTHISILAELNVPIKAIVERAGHSDERLTLAIYTHVTENTKRDVLSKLENIKY